MDRNRVATANTAPAQGMPTISRIGIAATSLIFATVMVITFIAPI